MMDLAGGASVGPAVTADLIYDGPASEWPDHWKREGRSSDRGGAAGAVDARFTGEAARRERNHELRSAGDGSVDSGCRSSIRVVHCEDARGTMALERASVVGVYEGADEEGGNEDEEDDSRSSTGS